MPLSKNEPNIPHLDVGVLVSLTQHSPQLPQCFTKLCVVEIRVLVCQLPSCTLCPHLCNGLLVG